MADRIVHELNNFHDCIPEVSFFIVRGEVPIVKHSLVKKVLSMHLHELTWKKDRLNHLSLGRASHFVAKEALASLNLYFYRRKDFMVNWRVQRLHELVFVQLLLEADVWGNVCYVEDLAQIFVLQEILSLKNHNLRVPFHIVIHGLHLVDFLLVCLLFIVYDFLERPWLLMVLLFYLISN